jgi:hypothetical protein
MELGKQVVLANSTFPKDHVVWVSNCSVSSLLK